MAHNTAHTELVEVREREPSRGSPVPQDFDDGVGVLRSNDILPLWLLRIAQLRSDRNLIVVQTLLKLFRPRAEVSDRAWHDMRVVYRKWEID